MSSPTSPTSSTTCDHFQSQFTWADASLVAQLLPTRLSLLEWQRKVPHFPQVTLVPSRLKLVAVYGSTGLFSTQFKQLGFEVRGLQNRLGCVGIPHLEFRYFSYIYCVYYESERFVVLRGVTVFYRERQLCIECILHRKHRIIEL